VTSRETERIRELYDRDAPRYDRTMRFFERILFRDARSWVCSKAEGKTLERGIRWAARLIGRTTGTLVSSPKSATESFQRFVKYVEQLRAVRDIARDNKRPVQCVSAVQT
jgi:hypothetical protein